MIERLLQKIMSQSGVPESENGLRVPDARPIYLYTLDQKAFETCGEFLQKALHEYHSAGQFNRPKWLSGLLVFYGAHWFRRESSRTMQRWAALDILPAEFNTWERGRLVQDGLKYWGLEVYHSGHDRRWLHTLALNGGIPAKLLSTCLLYTSPSPRDGLLSRMPSSA